MRASEIALASEKYHFPASVYDPLESVKGKKRFDAHGDCEEASSENFLLESSSNLGEILLLNIHTDCRHTGE